MFNKFSKLLTLSTTVLSLGLASTSATFAKTNLTQDQILKFSQLSQFLKSSIEKNIKTAGEIAHTYRGNGSPVSFATTVGGNAGNGVGEVNLSVKNGNGEEPPVVSMAVFNLKGSDTDNFEVLEGAGAATLYDKDSSALNSTFSALVMKVMPGTTGITGIDEKFIIIALHHGEFSDTNQKQGADLSNSMKTKCFTNMSALEAFAGFAGDKTALQNEGLLTREGTVDIGRISEFVANCQRVDVNVTLNGANQIEADTGSSLNFVKYDDNANRIIDKIDLTYVN